MTSPSSSLSAAPVLAHVVRSGFVESVHHGSVVAVDGCRGRRCWRSATSPVRRSPGPPTSRSRRSRCCAPASTSTVELLALASASHSGEAFHLEGVRRILAGAGLTEADLQNTPDLPLRRRRAAGAGSPRAARPAPWRRTAPASTPRCSRPASSNGWDTGDLPRPRAPAAAGDGARPWPTWRASRWPPPASTAAAPRSCAISPDRSGPGVRPARLRRRGHRRGPGGRRPSAPTRSSRRHPPRRDPPDPGRSRRSSPRTAPRASTPSGCPTAAASR